jgi:hypothetical protein
MEYGVFHTIIPDDAKKLTQKDYLRIAQKAGSIIHPVEPFSPNQNKAESANLNECIKQQWPSLTPPEFFGTTASNFKPKSDLTLPSTSLHLEGTLLLPNS